MVKINESVNEKSRDTNGRSISEKQQNNLNHNDSYMYDCYCLPEVVKVDYAYAKKMAPIQAIDFSSAPTWGLVTNWPFYSIFTL